jgi:hypothetical protein
MKKAAPSKTSVLDPTPSGNCGGSAAAPDANKTAAVAMIGGSFNDNPLTSLMRGRRSSFPPLCRLRASSMRLAIMPQGLGRRSSSGSLAMFRANAPASSCDIKFSRRSPAWFFFKIDVGESLSVTILHDETGLAFFDRPGRRQAERGHRAMIAPQASVPLVRFGAHPVPHFAARDRRGAGAQFPDLRRASFARLCPLRAAPISWRDFASRFASELLSMRQYEAVLDNSGANENARFFRQDPTKAD